MAIQVLLFALRTIPILLCFIWIFGAFLFYWSRERNSPLHPQIRGPQPPISIIIPCHNEEYTISRTIRSLDALNYPDYDILAVNDSSSDGTLAVLEALALTRPRMSVLDLPRNMGKAAALNAGILASRRDYVVCMDADSEMNPDAPSWLIAPLTETMGVAGVTGNPRVKNRGTLIGRVQVGEFSAIIGVIKRYHQVVGGLFALSGVLVAFKKQALVEIGLLDTDCVTEDIAVTWKLQRAGWDVRYEPHALCDVLMPDTVMGLWRQRMRWACGGFDVVCRHIDILAEKGRWPLKVILLEYALSVAWAFLLPIVAIYGAAVRNVAGTPLLIVWISPVTWSIFLAGGLSLAQFAAGFYIHGRYEKNAGRFAYWAMWYPFLYWILNSAVLLVGIPKVIFAKPKDGLWTSPDRGGLSYEATRSSGP